MKPAYYIIALTNVLLASAVPTGEQSGRASEPEVSPFSKLDTFEHANVGAEAYCGGFYPAECSGFCYDLGYYCYQCTASTCRCTNSGC